MEYPGVPWSTLKECAARARRSGRVCARSTFVLADGGGSPRQLCAKDSAGDAAAVHRRLLLGTPTAPTSPRARALAHAHRKRSRRCMRTHARTHAQAHAHSSVPHRVAAGGALLSYMQLMQCATCCMHRMQQVACCMQHAAFAHAHPRADRQRHVAQRVVADQTDLSGVARGLLRCRRVP
jgi:hypothetical protein